MPLSFRRRQPHAEQLESVEAAEEADPDLSKAETATPDISDIHQKLAAIAEDPFRPRLGHNPNDHLLGLYNLYPGPIRPGLRYMHEPESDELSIMDIDLGDRDLEGRGIGTLLVAAAVQDGLKRDPNLWTITRSSGSLPFVKAVGKVVGLHNLRLEVDGIAYGVTPDLPAEAAWENHPRDEEFPARNITGIIDMQRLSGLDIPSQLQRLTETGRVGLWGKPEPSPENYSTAVHAHSRPVSTAHNQPKGDIYVQATGSGLSIRRAG